LYASNRVWDGYSVGRTLLSAAFALVVVSLDAV